MRNNILLFGFEEGGNNSLYLAEVLANSAPIGNYEILGAVGLPTSWDEDSDFLDPIGTAINDNTPDTVVVLNTDDRAKKVNFVTRYWNTPTSKRMDPLPRKKTNFPVRDVLQRLQSLGMGPLYTTDLDTWGGHAGVAGYLALDESLQRFKKEGKVIKTIVIEMPPLWRLCYTLLELNHSSVKFDGNRVDMQVVEQLFAAYAGPVWNN